MTICTIAYKELFGPIDLIAWSSVITAFKSMLITDKSFKTYGEVGNEIERKQRRETINILIQFFKSSLIHSNSIIPLCDIRRRRTHFKHYIVGVVFSITADYHDRVAQRDSKTKLFDSNRNYHICP